MCTNVLRIDTFIYILAPNFTQMALELNRRVYHNRVNFERVSLGSFDNVIRFFYSMSALSAAKAPQMDNMGFELLSNLCH